MLGLLGALSVCGTLVAEEEGTEEEETAANPLTEFGKAVPAGVDNTGVWIPGFENGQKSTLVEAQTVTRVDDQRLKIVDMTIHLYGEQKAEDVRVDMPTATYHMDNQILSSASRSKVVRQDFELEGDAMIFDTVTSQGRMTGNVRMTIFDSSAFVEAESEETDAESVDADSVDADAEEDKEETDSE